MLKNCGDCLSEIKHNPKYCFSASHSLLGQKLTVYVGDLLGVSRSVFKRTKEIKKRKTLVSPIQFPFICLTMQYKKVRIWLAMAEAGFFLKCMHLSLSYKWIQVRLIGLVVFFSRYILGVKTHIFHTKQRKMCTNF